MVHKHYKTISKIAKIETYIFREYFIIHTLPWSNVTDRKINYTILLKFVTIYCSLFFHSSSRQAPFHAAPLPVIAWPVEVSLVEMKQ